MRRGYITLNDGYMMPSIGFGTWQIPKEEVSGALNAALEAGYRHIDAAPVYLNQPEIGEVLKEWLSKRKLKRSDLFVTTKLPPIANRPNQVEESLRRSLKELKLDYVDLYLIHTPFTLDVDENGDIRHNKDGEVVCDYSTNHIAIWKKMEELVLKGLAKSIGISNFNKHQIEKLLSNCTIPPAVLQIEFHIYLQQRALLQACKPMNITVTAYSPLGCKGIRELDKAVGVTREIPDLLAAPDVEKIANRYKKTSAQVLLRWIIQHGLAAIPRSTNKAHIRENIEIHDFKLDSKEMEKLDLLDANIRIVNFNFFKGVEKHPEFPFK